MTKSFRSPRTDLERRILRVLDYIHDNPGGDLSLDALAEVAAMSRFHWHRVYRGITGETVAQSVRRIRLNRAAMALVSDQTEIAEIARSVGYDNPASFARMFAEHYGVTPLVFRKRGQMRPDRLEPRKGAVPMSENPVNVREEQPRMLAAMPHKGPYHHIDRAFEKLAGVIGARQLFDQTRGMVGVFYDDPSAVEEAELRSHAGFAFADAASITDPMERVDLPGGRHAVLIHKGPYTGLPASYDHLYCNWLPESGETPADAPSFEVYLNSPMDTAPEDLLTELHLPLA